MSSWYKQHFMTAQSYLAFIKCFYTTDVLVDRKEKDSKLFGTVLLLPSTIR